MSKAKKQGKIISVSVTEVTEGMQVYYEKCTKVLYIEKVDSDKSVVWLTTLESTKGSYFTKDLKTLVVEYEEFTSFEVGDSTTTKQLPLKHAQWQAAIDNDEVDSNKVVEFEIIKQEDCKCDIDKRKLNTVGCLGGMDCKAFDVSYAKVIPSKETWDSIKQQFDKKFHNDYPTFVNRTFRWLENNYNAPTKKKLINKKP